MLLPIKNKTFSNCSLEIGTVCALETFYRGTNGYFIDLLLLKKG